MYVFNSFRIDALNVQPLSVDEMSATLEFNCAGYLKLTRNRLAIYLTSDRHNTQSESISCGNNVTFTGLQGNTQYRVEVWMVVDDSENCLLSNSISFTTKGM